MKSRPLFSSKTNYSETLVGLEASDMIELQRGDRQDIREVVDELRQCIGRIKFLCNDIDNYDQPKVESESSSSYSDVICL